MSTHPSSAGSAMGRLVVAVACLAAVIVGGCAKFSPDAGMDYVQAHTAGDLGKQVVKIRTEEEAAAATARVRRVLSKPMTVETSVQVALLNNRTLQAAYSDLGMSEAQMVEASLPPSPTLSLSKLIAAGEFELEKQIVQNVLGLLTLPRRQEIAEARFQQAKIRAVEATLKTATDARRAWYRAVSANRTVVVLDEARTTAEALSDLAKKLGETGALSKLDQAREHAFTAEINGQLATARLKQRVERERVLRTLGVWGHDAELVKLPSTLPPLPKTPSTFADVETEAVKRRVDLEIARQDLDILAKQLGLTRATRYVDLLEVTATKRLEQRVTEKTSYTLDAGPPPALRSETERETERTRWFGLGFEVKIPIYDFGEARTRLAEETYMAAVHRLIAKGVDVRSEAREAYLSYRGAFDIARHHAREIVPLRRLINDEMLLNYNGMLKDLFALLSDTKARVNADVQAVDTVRDHWLAKVDLSAALVGGGMTGAAVGASTMTGGGSGEPAH